MGTPPANLGPLLDERDFVFRAFALDGFRDRKANRVRPRAYYRSSDHSDGLSVGLTPRDAVNQLHKNHGYCRLGVGPVHQLPHGLEVRIDTQLAGHALIHNVPAIDGTDEERLQATRIAGDLARLSEVMTCDHYQPGESP